MKTKTILVAFCLIASYTTNLTSASAATYQINDTTAIFLTEFTVNASYGTMQVPLIADHTVTYNDKVNVVGYELTTDSDSLPAITSISDIVLSSASIVNNRYEVANGSESTFTVMTLVTFAEPIESNITSTITKLPFWVDGARTTVHKNQLIDIDSVTLNFSVAK